MLFVCFEGAEPWAAGPMTFWYPSKQSWEFGSFFGKCLETCGGRETMATYCWEIVSIFMLLCFLLFDCSVGVACGFENFVQIELICRLSSVNNLWFI